MITLTGMQPPGGNYNHDDKQTATQIKKIVIMTGIHTEIQMDILVTITEMKPHTCTHIHNDECNNLYRHIATMTDSHTYSTQINT